MFQSERVETETEAQHLARRIQTGGGTGLNLKLQSPSSKEASNAKLPKESDNAVNAVCSEWPWRTRLGAGTQDLQFFDRGTSIFAWLLFTDWGASLDA
jgi:hypothetical protein